MGRGTNCGCWQRSARLRCPAQALGLGAELVANSEVQAQDFVDRQGGKLRPNKAARGPTAYLQGTWCRNDGQAEGFVQLRKRARRAKTQNPAQRRTVMGLNTW